MLSDSLTNLYQWARDHLGQPIMLGYVLHKVNGQTPGSLLLLLRQRGSLRPEAEIQIDYTPDRVSGYQAHFESLPFTGRIPRPDRLQVSLDSPSAVIEWLLTGHKRIQFSAGSEDGEKAH